MDLSTTYLGLTLDSPLMCGSSPMTDDTDTVRRLSNAGVAAIVMHSIYQEQITYERTNRLWYEDMYSNKSAYALSQYPHPGDFAHTPHEYLRRIGNIKKITQVPLIASINCTSRGTWMNYAQQLESAGADAVELNVYFLPTNRSESAADVERRVVEIVQSTVDQVHIPLAVKLSPFYSSLPHFIEQLESAGASGAVLFNRFYQPDFAVDTKRPAHTLNLSQMSDPIELRLRLRWLAILSPQTKLSLALTGGVHTGLDAIKGIMAGAHAIQVVSSLLNGGPEYLQTIREGLIRYMKEVGAESVQQLRGCMNHRHSSDPSAMERGAYLSILHRWGDSKTPPEGLHAF
jgi:dihydroorotate dehydrogenase (fumarate)